MKINELRTPCYVIDEGKLTENLFDIKRCHAKDRCKDSSGTEGIQRIL